MLNVSFSIFQRTRPIFQPCPVGTTSVLADITSDSFRRYASTQAEEGLSSDRATALAEDQTGKLWVGTDGGGLNRLEAATGRFERFRLEWLAGK